MSSNASARSLGSWFWSRELSNRVRPIDVLRGLTVAAMILVNHPGPSGTVYGPLSHSDWDGWTLADTIFPAFLFLVGLSVPFAYADAQGLPIAASINVYSKILRRATLLILINALLVNFPYFDPATLKFTGTLTRIALCGTVATLLFLHSSWRWQVVTLALLLIGYCILLTAWDAPLSPTLEPLANGEVVRYLDRMLLGNHYVANRDDGFDSDGLVASVSALSSTLFGTLTGLWLRTRSNSSESSASLLAVGYLLCLLGSTWGWFHPINKPLWSSSYATLMAGLSMMTLGFLYWLERWPCTRRWFKIFEIAGVNALAFYIGSQALQRLLVYGRISLNGNMHVRLRAYTFEHLIAPWLSGELAALVYALVFLGVCFVPIYWMFRARIFFKL